MSDDITSQFIVDENEIKQNTEELVKKALKYGKITKNGSIILEAPDLSQEKKLKLCLILRFLAHELQEDISPVLRPVDLVTVLGTRIEAVGAGLSKLAKEGFARKEGVGRYIVRAYKIEKFFDELDNSTSLVKTTSKKSKKKISTHSIVKNSIKKKKTRKSSTIGLDIQDLVDSGFFNTPKFVSEVKSKLEEKVKFYDIRVVDRTLTQSFVLGKDILERVRIEGNGKAKWKYVVK